jgi:hypothetical protein
MHLKNQPPVLVPTDFRAEVEGLSKAALMDIAWSYATRSAGHEGNLFFILLEFRRERDAVLAVRKQSKEPAP